MRHVLRTTSVVLPAFLLCSIPLHAQAVARWTLQEDLRIGSLDNEATAFGQIGAVRIGPQGRIYIAEPRAWQLRVFDADGRPVARMGRRGRGPGEFESITEMGEGALWIRAETRPDAPIVPWQVHDTTGAHVANLEIPQAVRIHAANRDALYAVVRDDPGVDYVVRFRILR